MKRFLFILLFPILIVAQKQPKVGVVLSGGGAKGIAHIAVLKELEKAGVQIDYIGGTSMGAIIGGLYSAGYSAKQIEHLFFKTDFTSLLQDKVPRGAKPFFEKANGEKYAISLPVRKNSIIGLPKGVSKGQNTLNFLTELLAPVDTISDFSKLPTPFYCIATNVETGERVVLDKGSLPLSLRASGSFPTLLHPVEIDGKLLIDGGIANNFPVDEMKKRGADIIIGVDVQNELADKKKLTSVVAILNQITAYQMYKTTEKQKEQVDVYIHPEIVGYNVVSFDKAEEILKKGEEIAKKSRLIFKSIAKQQFNKTPRKKIYSREKKFLVDRIIIEGNENYTEDYVLGTLQLQEQDSINYREMSEKINRLTATKNFDRIDYNFSESFNCKNLFIKLKENETRSFLRLGLHYDLLYKSGVLINYTYKRLLTQNDIFSLDVVVGDNIRYNLNYFIDNGLHWGLGVHSTYNSFNSDFNFDSDGSGINKLNVNYQEFKNGLYIETKFDKKIAFGFGTYLRTIKASTETLLTNNETTFFDNSNYLVTNSFLKLDTFDKPYYPTSGVYADAEFNWYLWSDRNKKEAKLTNPVEFSQFSQIAGTFSIAKTFFNKLTLQSTFDGGYTLGEERTEVFDFRLGSYNRNFTESFIRFYGYDLAGLINQAFIKGELDFRYQIISKNYVSFIANYARVSNRSIFDKGDLLKDIKTGYAVGYGLETFLGPIELKYAWSPENKKDFWFFNLGFWF